MTISLQDIRNFYPDLTECLTDEEIQARLEEVEVVFNCFAGFKSKVADLATKYAVGHFIFLNDGGALSQGGQLQSVKNKQDRVSFVAPYTFGTEGVFGLSSTKYGASLLRLLRYQYAGGRNTGTRTC